MIELDPEFPYKTPKLWLEPNLAHPWIEEGKITKFPGLVNFTVNSDLGRVAQAIIREFEKKPAVLANSAPTVPVQIQSNIPELNDLDYSQLVELLNDDSHLDDFVEELRPIKALNAALDQLIEETEELAKANLEKNSTLTDLKASVDSKSVEFLELGDQYNSTNKRYIDKADEYSPENIRALLEIGVSNAESDCEETVKKFLDGQQPVSDFLEEFTKHRMCIATRKFKEERLNFQLNQLKL